MWNIKSLRNLFWKIEENQLSKFVIHVDGESREEVDESADHHPVGHDSRESNYARPKQVDLWFSFTTSKN